MSNPTTDRFRNLYSDTGPLDGPLTRVVAITPADTDLAFIPRAIIVGVAGDVAVKMVDDPATAVTIKNVPAGIPLWIRPARVLSSGTTATNIVICD